MSQPLVKNLLQKKQANDQQKRAEQNYIIEVKLELVKKVGIVKAKDYFKLISHHTFPEFSHYWRAMESIIVLGEVPTRKKIEEVFLFMHEE